MRLTLNARHIRKHVPTHVRFAALLFAAAVAIVGMRTDYSASESMSGEARTCVSAHGVGEAGTHASARGFEAAELDGSGWAVRDVNIQVLSERLSDRKPNFDRGLGEDATLHPGDFSPVRALTGAAAVRYAAPPRLLFYLHSALLI